MKGTQIGGGFDTPFLDDFYIKEGTLPAHFEERLFTESPKEWFDWGPPQDSNTFTVTSGDWIVHYKEGFPLCIYHNERFVFGLDKPPSPIYLDLNSPDCVWARIDGRVVVEREDYVRFQTKDIAYFSHNIHATEHDNVYSLGNGYVVACTKKVNLFDKGAISNGECWWMVAPEEEAEEVSRRVFTLKIYDGPHPYQARGTDIRLSDPIPLSLPAEYVIYSYDDSGLKGLYKEIYQGIRPQKHALTLRGQDLIDYIKEKDGDVELKNNQLSVVNEAPVRITYSFPIRATKLLEVYHRGSETLVKIKPDNEEWVDWAYYDGKAVYQLEIEALVYTSLASIRVEWEGLKNWEPVGRPTIDILPAGWGGSVIKIKGEETEGLGQQVDLYTGEYTASANVRVHDGRALISVGGIEVVSWQELDKSIRGAGNFVVNNGDYDVLLTGEVIDNDTFTFEIDRFRIGEAGQKEWIPQDLEWYVETEKGKFPASESINEEGVPVALTEAKRWRLGIKAPEKMGDVDNVAINAAYITAERTGEQQVLKTVRWGGEGKSRLYFPRNVVHLPFFGPYIPLDGRGAISWEQEISADATDVRLTIDDSVLSYTNEFIYREMTLQNERWRVEIRENDATVYFNNEEVAYLLGRALPLRIVQNNPEDVQLDCSVGFVQMRRGLGPRFEGWTMDRTTIPVSADGSTVVFGTTNQEALENLPFYTIKSAR